MEGKRLDAPGRTAERCGDFAWRTRNKNRTFQSPSLCRFGVPKGHHKAMILRKPFSLSLLVLFCFVLGQYQSKGDRVKEPSNFPCKVMCFMEQIKTCQVCNMPNAYQKRCLLDYKEHGLK